MPLPHPNPLPESMNHGPLLPRRLVGLLLLLVGAAPLQAQDMVVPIETQAEIFNVTFKLNRTIQGVQPLRILVLYNGATDPAQLRQIVAAFRKRGHVAEPLHMDQLKQVDRVDAEVLYIAPGIHNIDGVGRKYKVLTITGMPHLVERNAVSLGTNNRNNKPGIIANLISLKSEDQEMLAAFLSSSVVQLIR